MWRIALLYFVSGVAALAVETVWMRWLRLLLGATAPAASATLVAFFTGHALGAAWGARRVATWRRPLRVYGGLELAAALTGLAVPLALAAGQLALAAVYDGLHESPGRLAALRYGLALVATLPTAFCFGATFPAVVAASLARLREVGSRGGALYAVNTAGAALGTALAAFVLPGRVGVRATYALALALAATVGVLALGLARREATTGPMPTGRPRRKARAADAREASRPSSALLAALAAGSGFGSFALQVLLVHAFGLVLNQSIYAFGAVLVGVLVAIACSAAAVAWLDRKQILDPRTLLGLALLAAALALAGFPAWLHRVTDGLQYVGSAEPGLPYLLAALRTVATAAGPVLLAASLVLPGTFALAGLGGARDDVRPGAGGALLGRLVAVNTAGAIAGALAAPYLLLPWAGPWGAFLALSGLYALAAIAVPDATAWRRRRREFALAIGWVAVLVQANPLELPVARILPDEQTVAVESTPAGVVAVVAKDGERSIRVDNHYVLGGTAEQVHEERQGHLPLLLHPEARRVAFVGTATGISAGAALRHEVERIHLVEIVPGVARAARDHFAAANRRVYQDPRSVVVLDDARNFVRSTSERFDLLVADLFVPWRAGTGSLYTGDHFRAVHAHLAEDGVFCQWLPLYQLGAEELHILLATFLDVFPRAALWRGDFYGGFPIVAMVGWKGAVAPAAAVSAAATRLAGRGVPDRWVTDPVGVWALHVAALAPMAPELAGAPRNRDDRPWMELLGARGHAGGRVGKARPIVGLEWVRLAERIRSRKGAEALYPALSTAQRNAVRGGAVLQRAGALWFAGEREAAARAFAEAAALLPARLVSQAPADATAAELWAGP